ncbi:MAG: hypothetical protein PHT48_07505 [Dechloromonas sp.]|nr:hypothetical protein [Dechloromonas sp.]
MNHRDLSLHTPHGALYGHLRLPTNARGLIALLRCHQHAVDSLRMENLATHGLAVLSMDLLTSQELQFSDATQNVPRLTQRILDILALIAHDDDMNRLRLILWAHGEASPAAIRAATQRDTQVNALICQGGLIDKAGLQGLKFLAAPLLMLLDDDPMTQAAFERAASHLPDCLAREIGDEESIAPFIIRHLPETPTD